MPINDATKLWILGGSDNSRNSGRLESTVYVDLEGNTQIGPDMPQALTSHAVVAVDNSTYLLIGGCTEDDCSSEKTYYFSDETQKWSPGPDLKEGRSLHTAGLITDLVTEERYIVVTGGYDLDSTEILYPGATRWERGKQ